MGQIRLHAIGIDEIRDMFGADADRASTLRSLAAEKFRVPEAENAPRGLLSKIGPLFRHDPHAPQLPSSYPTPNDIENLLAGRFVPPDRINHAWEVMDAWLDGLSWGRHELNLTESGFNDLEFGLARAGLPSRYSLAKLAELDPALVLRPAHGMRIGYSRHAHVDATREALAEVWASLEADHQQVASGILDFLSTYPHWTQLARKLDRPEPDLFVTWRV
ncbi:MAG TPA: hypothetical protein VLR88_09640 [Propionibacteriaceae bacterium]|nr:hypothetical protein [Propionibacteriaceae bacterium]